jgi:hypothetical protein
MVGSAYDYDTLEPVPPAPAPEVVASAGRREPRLVGQATGGVRVENAPADVELKAAPEVERAAARGGAGERWFLRLSGIQSTGAPGGVLDVHLDPENSAEISGPPAASLAFFAVAPRAALAESAHTEHDQEERVLDVTDRVRALIAQGAEPGTLKVRSDLLATRRRSRSGGSSCSRGDRRAWCKPQPVRRADGRLLEKWEAARHRAGRCLQVQERAAARLSTAMRPGSATTR